MKCFLVLSLVIIATVLIEPTVSSCYHGSININVDENYNIDHYCDGPKGRMEVDGPTVRDGCTECSCSKDGLSCCGIGYAAGTFNIEGCEIKKEAETCCYQFFKTDDPSESCTKKFCPDD